MNPRIVALLMAFLVMGFGDLRGSFLGISREVFGISAAQGALIPMAGASAFALCALPVGLLATRRGKRFVLQAGLLLTAAAHALPWFVLSRYEHLLAAIFLIGAGMTFLLVSGNPLLRDVTEPARYSRNLTFAQFFKSLGSIAGPSLVPLVVVLGLTWKGVFPVFALASLAVWAVVTWVPFPETPAERPASLKGMLALLGTPPLRGKILGIFLFSGSEMGMNNFLASHLWLTFGMDIQKEAITWGQGLFWVSQGAGRLLGTLALGYLSTRSFLRVCSVGSLLGLGGLILGSREVAIASVVLCGLAFSNVWPCLFALTLEARPDRSSEIGGLAVMANVGGAFLPLLMGAVTDHSAVRWAFLVPLGALAYVAGLARLRCGTS
ncbi:MFS transporter [Mesoterricola silvestris]|uniref:MFS transporter n=1 Tax=Mesoterricola silvestris TaxID=2927979 RepID=A0AA48GTH2_9BACT|nr:MFS transporter [Mesoterricola silvestris]BDU74040.1 MFS transporter [Mesoterricola silvestris]